MSQCTKRTSGEGKALLAGGCDSRERRSHSGAAEGSETGSSVAWPTQGTGNPRQSLQRARHDGQSKAAGRGGGVQHSGQHTDNNGASVSRIPQGGHHQSQGGDNYWSRPLRQVKNNKSPINPHSLKLTQLSDSRLILYLFLNVLVADVSVYTPGGDEIPHR